MRDELREKEFPNRVLDRRHAIGESLAQFKREHAPRIVHSRTAIIIASDGYDTGEPALLAGALVALRRRARRIVWLRPLCERPGYSLQALGMRAALPHLDLLAPGGGLRDIERVLPRHRKPAIARHREPLAES